MSKAPQILDKGQAVREQHRTFLPQTTEQVYAEPSVLGKVPRPVQRFFGATLDRVCPVKQPCTNTRCWVRPFCKCASSDWAKAKKTEARVWFAMAACGAGVLIVSIVRAMTG